MTKGKLHSLETFGAVDGPGIRTVFFMQGCPARCTYCHNPDSWKVGTGRDIDVDEILHRAKRGIPYYGSEGGVTFSGGEPLLQGNFVLEAIKALKAEGIHTAVDTSGTYFDDNSAKVIEAADLVLLDIKHVDPAKFKDLTGRKQDPLFKVIDAINEYETPVWIRQVIMPDYNDTEEYIASLNEFLSQIKTIQKVELLPYHNMAEKKYAKLGMDYPLKHMKPMSRAKVEELKKITLYT